MLDAGENTAPVTTVQSFINDAVDFYIDLIAAQDSIVDATQQIEKPALFAHGRIAGLFLTVSPCLGFVVRHGRKFNSHYADYTEIFV
jgi:hypothetical protein